MKILVTGCAGFIGFHLTQRLLRCGHTVMGIDNLNDYYDVQLKLDRIEEIQDSNFCFQHLDVVDSHGLKELFAAERFECVIHLAAQAGVRYSLQNPSAYINSNLVGFTNILEVCRHHQIGHLIYASSSSVYGLNSAQPYSVNDPVNHPVSLYAATKKANELLAHSYSHLYQLPTTGLRFFTVYGPWGRPDMAYFSFTKAILAGQPIKLYNHGQMARDFTYVDDVTEAIERLAAHPAQPDPSWSSEQPLPSTSSAPYQIYNVGNNQPVVLNKFVETLERVLGERAIIELVDMQPGDVLKTYADVKELETVVDFSPSTPLEYGLNQFAQWYRNYFNV